MSEREVFLVIGSGSIAKRHLANLKKLFPAGLVCCVSNSGRSLNSSDVGADVVFEDLSSALSIRPIMVVVASPSPFHLSQAQQVLAFGIPVLIEKPLTSTLALLSDVHNIFYENKKYISVAYNLRYLPSAREVKKLVDAGVLGRIYNAIVDVGQYLPDWRPGADYLKGVSAQKDMGGGAVLELSHELDYLLWFFGDFDSVFSRLSTSLELGLEVEDRVDALLFGHEGLVVNLHMDFLQRKPARTCKIVGSQGTVFWDLIENSVYLYSNGFNRLIYCDSDYDRNQMYLDEIFTFYSMVKHGTELSLGFDDGVAVMRMVEALKRSSFERKVMPVERAMR